MDPEMSGTYSFKASSVTYIHDGTGTTTTPSYSTCYQDTGVTFTVQVTACVSTLSLTSSSDQIYYIGASTGNTQTVTQSESRACGKSISGCTISTTTDLSWLVSATTTSKVCTFKWSTTDTTKVGVYTVNYSVVYGTTTTSTSSGSFKITVKCDSTLTVTKPSDQSYTIKSATASLTVSKTEAPTCGFTQTCSKGSSAPSWVTVDSATCLVSWTVTDLATTITSYTVPISISLATSTAKTYSTSFVINLVECPITSSVSSLTDQIYYLTKTVESQSITASDISTNPACGYTATCSMTQGDSTLVSLTGCTVSWVQSSLSFATGIYPVTIKVVFNNPSVTTISNSFNIDVRRCTLSAQVSDLSDQTYTIKSSASSQTITATDISINPNCGYTATCTPVTGDSTLFTFSGCQITWQQTSLTYSAGTYPVSVIVAFNDYTTTTVTKSFNLVVQVCPININYPQPSDQIYYIKGARAQTEVTLTPTDSSTSPACGYTATCSAGAVEPTWVTVGSNCVVSWELTSLTFTTGTYVVQVLATYNNPAASTSTQSFNIVVKECALVYTKSTPDAKTYVIKATSNSQSITITETSSCGYTFRCTAGSANPTWVTVSTTSTGCYVSWYNDDITLAPGTQQASIDVSFDNPSLTIENIKFDIDVSSCVISASIFPPSDKIYLDDGTTGTQTITAQDTSCGYVPTCSSDSGNPNWVSVSTLNTSPTECKIEWQNSDPSSFPGTNSVKINVSFNTPTTATVVQKSFNLQTCYLTSLNLVDKIYYLKGGSTASPSESQTIAATDSYSCSYRPTCTKDPSSPDWATLNGCVVTWQTSDWTQSIGEKTVKVYVSWDTSPVTVISKSFKINLQYCDGDFSVTSPSDQIYKAKDTQGSITIVSTDSSSCTYTGTCTFTHTLTSSQVTNWGINQNGCTLSWSTQDITLEATSTDVQVTVTFDDSRTSPTVISANSFKLTLNTCTPVFYAQNPSSQTYVTKQTTQGSVTISTGDSSSCGYTATCVKKDSAPTWVSVDLNTCKVTWSLTDISVSGGTYSAPVTVSLNTVPVTTKDVSFDIFLTTCQGNFQVTQIYDQIYNIKDQGSVSVVYADKSSCGYTAVCSKGLGIPDWVWLSDTENCLVQWYNDDLTLTAQDYQVPITLTFNTIPTQDVQTYFSIKLNPCEGDFQVYKPYHFTYRVADPMQSQTIQAEDTSNCDYSYKCEITSSPKWVSQGSEDCDIQWQTSDLSLEQKAYQVQIKVTFDDLSKTEITTEFYITLSQCIGDFNLLPAFSNVVHLTSDKVGTQSISPSDVSDHPQCKYSPTCTKGVLTPSWVTVEWDHEQAKCQAVWLTTEQSFESGIYTVYVTVTFDTISDYAHQFIFDSVFTITVTNECDADRNWLIKSETPELHQMSYNKELKLVLQPTDYASNQKGTPNLCGNYLASYSTDYARWLQVKTGDLSISLLQMLMFDQETTTSITVTYSMELNPAITLSQTFQINAEFCAITELIASTTSIIQHYRIGSGLKSFQLSEYSMKPLCPGDYTVTYQQIQLPSGGTDVSLSDVQIQGAYFRIDVKDKIYEGQTAVFQIVATLDNPGKTKNSDLVFTVFFDKAAEEKLESVAITQSDTPIFTSEVLPSAEIPCLKDDAARAWSYTFPQVNSFGQQVKYEFDAPGLTRIFNTDWSTGIFTLTLVKSKSFQPYPGFYPATMKLSFISGKPLLYETGFEIGCPAKFALGVVDFRPVPKVTKITPEGDIYITWNDTMELIAGFNVTKGRLLGSQINQMPVRVKVSPGSPDEDVNNLNFTYSLIQPDPLHTVLRMNFTNPVFVSSSIHAQDNVTIIFNASNLFISKTNRMSVEKDFEVVAKLPRLNSPGQVALNVAGVVQVAKGAMLLSLAMPIVLQAVLQQLLSVIRSMTIVVHMFLISLLYPPNAMKFFGLIFPIVNFQIIPTELIFDKAFGFGNINENGPLTPQFDDVGYNNRLAISNLGTVFLTFAVGPILIALCLALNKCSKCMTKIPIVGKKLAKQFSQISKGAFWNIPIAFFYESYMMVAISCLIQLTNLNMNPSTAFWSEIFSDSVAIVGIILVIIFPFLIGIVYFKTFKSARPMPSMDELEIDQIYDTFGTLNRIKIEKEFYTTDHLKRFQDTYGILTLEVDYFKTGAFAAILSPLLLIFRRLVISIALVLLIKWPILVLFIVTFTSISVLGFELNHLPRLTRFEQVRAFVNEANILLVCYHFICFTDFVGVQEQTIVGNSLIYATVFNAVFNILMVIASSVPKIILYMKRAQYRHKFNKPRRVTQEDAAEEGAREQRIADEQKKINESKNARRKIQMPELNIQPSVVISSSFQAENADVLDQLSPLKDNSEDTREIDYQPVQQESPMTRSKSQPSPFGKIKYSSQAKLSLSNLLDGSLASISEESLNSAKQPEELQSENSQKEKPNLKLEEREKNFPLFNDLL